MSHDFLVICHAPELAVERRDWRALRARRERFTRAHFAACGGHPARLARLALETGFYSRNNAFAQLIWRFERTIEMLNLGGDGQ